jgi:hypothetical protein
MGIYASHLANEMPFQAPFLELRHGMVCILINLIQR